MSMWTPDRLVARASAALERWGLGHSPPELVKHRENAVFRVQRADGGYAALRLHRPNYHGKDALSGELVFMAEAERGGLRVPVPMPAKDGETLVHMPAVEGFPDQFASLLTWVDGVPLGETGRPLNMNAARVEQVFARLGASIAGLHVIADRAPHHRICRPSWNIAGLVGDEPLWGRFWDCPVLSEDQRVFLAKVRDRLRRELEAFDAGVLDYGLIHADLVRENILLDDEDIAFIDFDDCGYGYRIFELATVLLKLRKEAHFDVIERALLAGYDGVRQLSELERDAIPLFLVLRSVTYIGWCTARMDEPGMAERLNRVVKEVHALSQFYLQL